MTLAESTILVVDDEPVLRLTFSILLKQAGATVLTAEDGEDALDVLERSTVDVILTDKQMPKMDGLTMLETLRTRGVATPAVFFVNGVLGEDQAKMNQLNVVRTVTKPLHPSDLLKVLETAVAPLLPR